MKKNRKWLTMLLALVISFGLWIYVVAVENQEGNITLNNIPVVFSGEDLLREDYSLLITDSNVSSGVSLTFTGRFSDLNNLQKNKDDLEVIINVTHLRTAQEHSLSYDIAEISFPSSVSTQNISLTHREPSKVNLTLGNLQKKTIPMKVQPDVQVNEGYMPGRLTQNYEEIVIEGPENLVNQVEYAQAILRRENVGQSISAKLPYVLVGKDGEPIESNDIRSSVTEIEVSLPILMYKDVPLSVQVIEGGGATSDDAIVKIQPETIRISGDPTVLESIQTVKLSNIDLSSMMTNKETLTRAIVVPEGCKSLSGEQEASVTVQIKNKSIRQMRISSSSFQFVGCPLDMTVKSRTTVLLVTIRADEADIDQITEDNIRVVADLTGLTLGTNMTVPVEIYVDGFEGADDIGDIEYTILIDVVPVEDAEKLS